MKKDCLDKLLVFQAQLEEELDAVKFRLSLLEMTIEEMRYVVDEVKEDENSTTKPVGGK